MRNKKTYFQIFFISAVTLLSACTANLQVERYEKPTSSLEKETSDLAEVKADALNLAEQAGTENVLVVFDIDNTLMAMEQGLGADQWYEWQKELSKTNPCNPQNVGDRFAVQGALYFASAMRKTQPDGAELVKSIQDQGFTVISVTSRGMDYRLQAFRELRRNGFSFSRSAIGPPGGYPQPFIPVEKGRQSLYEDGVFFTAGQHKGQMLYALLEKTGTPLPRVIIIVDDKQKNLDAIIQTFSALGVSVHAWRYAAEDQNVANFNTELAADQWNAIKDALNQVQQVLGPDNYNLNSAQLPAECY